MPGMRLTTLLLLVCCFSANAQNCSTIPGMSPATAIPVCGTTSFTQNSVASCFAASIPCPCAVAMTTSNSFWYKFRCYQPGTQGLGFIITPQSGLDDYDWALFDVTGFADPNVVFTNMATQISVNLCEFTGATGCSPAGTTNINCEGQTNLWNQLAPMQIGHDYLLMVTNWSNSGLGYSLTFTGGDAQITNNVPPVINSVTTIGCNSAQLIVTFSEDIQCGSVTATGSEFSIMPGNLPIVGVTSSCVSGVNAITELTINMQSPLPSGNYTLVVNNGSDANTFLDACNIGQAAGSQIPFTINSQGTPVVTQVTYTGCAPSTLNVTMSNAILCSSIAGGSEFSISPGGVAINSVQTVCTPSVPNTTTFQIHLQNPLPQGNYQLVINNGPDNNTLIDTCNNSIPAGYNFPFVISPSPAPVINSVIFDECKSDKLILNFDKPIKCNTLTATGSEFTISPGSWPVTSASATCVNGTTTQVTLTLQNYLPAGNFNVVINNGTDANTLSDTCLSFIPQGYSAPFVTGQAPLPVFDSVTFDRCNPSFIKVYYSNAIKCNSISANGSDFSITGPSTVSITSAVTNTTCAQGFSNWVLLQLAQPINTMGNYTLHNSIGADGNGIIDTCNAIQSTAETIAFNVTVKPSAVFSSSVNWGCVQDTIVVSHPGGNGVNSWTWTFSDGTLMSGQNVSHNFPVSTVSAGVQLIVTNGTCSDTSSMNIPLNNAINAAFSKDADSVCVNRGLAFINNSTGSNLQFEWQFGDNSFFNGQTPPPHQYGASNLYSINLICTDNHGCKDTATAGIYVISKPVVSFSGLNDQYCTRESVALTANIQGSIDSYSWSNGNGITVQNQQSVNFNYTLQNNYIITLTTNDKFCGITEYRDSTNVYKIPVIDLGRDTMLCPQMRIQIGMPSNSGVTYLWNTGATTPQITTALSTGNYILTANNHGCIGSDEIRVEVLDGCLIRVPGAFTPNNDGRNDRLKAINAFLATNFTLKVYNRFGQLVFLTNDPAAGWDGRFKGQDEGTGTYVWMLSYTDPWTHLPVFQKGTSILIR